MNYEPANDAPAGPSSLFASKPGDVLSSSAADVSRSINAGSCLVLICCECENVVVIPYAGYRLPRLIEVDQKDLRSAVAYATCAQCQSTKAVQTRSAMNKVDFEQRRVFRKSDMHVDAALRICRTAGLYNVLRTEVKALTCSGQPTYFFLGVVRRSLEDHHRLRMVEFRRVSDGTSAMILTAHCDRTFL